MSWAASEIYDLLFHGIEHAELAIGNGDMVLMRIGIPGNLAGANVSSFTEPGKALVVAIDRMGTATIPDADATFQEGDVAHIIVARDSVNVIRERLEGDDG